MPERDGEKMGGKEQFRIRGISDLSESEKSNESMKLREKNLP
jgi:hypothetical protein